MDSWDFDGTSQVGGMRMRDLETRGARGPKRRRIARTTVARTERHPQPPRRVPPRPLWMPDDDDMRREIALETILLFAAAAVGILALCAIGGF